MRKTFDEFLQDINGVHDYVAELQEETKRLQFIIQLKDEEINRLKKLKGGNSDERL